MWLLVRLKFLEQWFLHSNNSNGCYFGLIRGHQKIVLINHVYANYYLISYNEHNKRFNTKLMKGVTIPLMQLLIENGNQ